MTNRIKALRKNNCLHQQDVAAYLRISQAQYSNIENCKSDITCSKVIALCRLYHVSADYLLGLCEEGQG